MSTAPAISSEMSLCEWQAYLIDRAAMTMAHFVATTESERLDWKPTVGGQVYTRSVLDMVGECIGVNNRFAALLEGKQAEEGAPIELKDAGEAQRMLIESAQALASVVRKLTSDAVERVFETKMGPLPGAILMELPMANMHYHSGQINMIQLLYGDETFHVPPRFF